MGRFLFPIDAGPVWTEAGQVATMVGLPFTFRLAPLMPLGLVLLLQWPGPAAAWAAV